MKPLGLLLLTLPVVGGVAVLRLRVLKEWRESLVTYRLRLPSGLTPDDLSRWYGMVAAASSPGSIWSFRPPPVLTIELVARNGDGISYYLLVPRPIERRLLDTVQAGLPGARIEAAADHLARTPRVKAAKELVTSDGWHLLAIDRAAAVSTAFLTALQLRRGQEICVVWQLTSAHVPRHGPRSQQRRDQESLPWWPTRAEPADTSDVTAYRIKVRDPLLSVRLRIGVHADTSREATAILSRVASTVRGANTATARVTTDWLPTVIVRRRIIRRSLPLIDRPMTLNSRELAVIGGMPIGELVIPGLSLGTSRHLPPSPTMPRSGVILARSNFPGSSTAIRLSPTGRASHLWILGPTGVGKSTLIANMMLQDATAGHGFVVVDPKSDLITDLLARLPASRHQDVVVLDPTAYSRDEPIVGLNVLGQGRTDHERELATDQIVHVLHSLWADSWGPRTSDVLHNAILTLTHAVARDGSALTLIDLPELLDNTAFRRFVVCQQAVPEAVRGFWNGFERYSEMQRLLVVGPAMNKIRAFSTRSALRLMLGQSAGIDLAAALNSGKIVLLPLAKGTIGTEAAQLIGALAVSTLASAIFARAAIPATRRRPVHVYIDEFQDVLRLPTDLADALAQARGMAASFVLANQYLYQLPDSARRAVLGTVRSAVVFRLQDYNDARVLERRFAPLTAADLMHLPAHEVAAVLGVDDAVRPVTGTTFPLPVARYNPTRLAHTSAERFGVRRHDVEAAMRARLASPQSLSAANAPVFGRRTVGDDK